MERIDGKFELDKLKMAIEKNKQLEEDKRELRDGIERLLLKSENVEDRKLAIDLLIKFKD